jgi:UDP-GlcNAc:undecaprenyl-phosphate/decaprenyl-phosphate GlcNAc-1-phosphate transferase
MIMTPSLLTTDILFIALIGFVVSLLVTRLMIRIGIADVPNRRSSHKAVTPKSGGMGIIAGFFTAMSCLYFIQKLGHISSKKLLLLGIGAWLTIVVSLYDDIKRISSSQKLIIQVMAALLVVRTGLSLTVLPLPWMGAVDLGPLGSVLAVFWIIFFINVFNFMDGLNGLTSGVSLVASFFCAIIGVLLEEKALFYVSISLGMATLGFFLFNFPKARIFMGDVGSQFMGLMWAILLLIPSQESHLNFMNLSIYTVPLLFFSFIYDVTITVGRRIWRREPFWLAHRTHLFQLLNRLGYTHTQVTCFHLIMAVLQGVGAIWMQYIEPTHQILLFLPYLFLMMGYHQWVTSAVQRKFSKIRRLRKHKK